MPSTRTRIRSSLHDADGIDERASARPPAARRRRVWFTPYRDGGMLVMQRRSQLTMVAVCSSALPWIATVLHTPQGPRFKRAIVQPPFDVAYMIAVIGGEHGDQSADPECMHAHSSPRAVAYARFLAVLDPSHLQVLQRFGGPSFRLYRMLRGCRGLLDLLAEGGKAPGQAGGAAIGYALAHLPYCFGHTHPMRTVRSLLHRKRTEILCGLGFAPATAALAVRALGRITLRELNGHDILNLRTALHRCDAHTCKLIAHAEGFDHPTTALLANAQLARYVTPRLLAEMHALACSNDRWTVMRRVEELVTLRILQGAHVPELRSLAALHAAYEAHVARPLPPAPVSDHPGRIEYIATREAMRLEGTQMRHCVADYSTVAAAGVMFVYRVLEPERATLSIVSGDDARLRVQQLCGPQNADVSPETRDAVERWLRGEGEPGGGQGLS
jgi:hypothetical protein